MAQVSVNFTSKVYIPLYVCQEVYFCLTDVWEGRTVSGTAFVLGKVENVGRRLDGHVIPQYAPDVRGDDLHQYEFTYDDAQITNPLNVIKCADIVEVVPYACTVGKLLALIGAGVTIVSADAGNILTVGTDGGALITCADIAECP